MAFGNNPVALEGSESKQGEVKRVSFLNATGLQTLVQNCGRALKKKPLYFTGIYCTRC